MNTTDFTRKAHSSRWEAQRIATQRGTAGWIHVDVDADAVAEVTPEA